MHENQDQNENPFSCTKCASKITNLADLNIQMSRYLENWYLEAGRDLEASDF